MTVRDYRPEYSIFTAADRAGKKAVEGLKVTPMNVVQHANPGDDNSPVVKSWHVPDGVCGFAYVIIKPATCRFVHFLKEGGTGYKHYYGGWSYPIHLYDQSLQKKEAYARAFAKVLNDHGIKAHVDSRMD